MEIFSQLMHVELSQWDRDFARHCSSVILFDLKIERRKLSFGNDKVGNSTGITSPVSTQPDQWQPFLQNHSSL